MKSWEEIAPEPLSFPIGGKSYTIPEVSYQAMLTIQKIKAGEVTELDDADSVETWRLVMGSAWDEMVADDVPAEAIARAGFAVLTDYEMGREAAEAVWENGIDPKALAAAIQSKTGPQQQNSTGAANVTRTQGSTSGTSSRPASSKKPRKTAKASHS